MDIRDWLQNTADREPPEEQENLSLPSFSQAQIGPPRPTRPNHQRKRRRASSEPRHEDAPIEHGPVGDRGQRPLHSSSPVRVRHAAREAATESPNHSRSGHSSVSEPVHDPMRSFERRARYKTRPDRYEAKPKRRKDDQRRRFIAKSKQRKSHRSGDGARTTGLVQSFQLKNGPKNNRLTLRPEANIGIFNNGRASVPMLANGPGLPDLVFNEMKFLSRSKNSEHHAVTNNASKQNKKGRKELREEEISAYFRNMTTERLAEQGRRLGHIPGDDSGARPETNQTAQVQSIQHRAELAHSPELLEKSSPGLGSSVIVPHQDTASRTCYTWSDTITPAQQAGPRDRSVSIRSAPPEQAPARGHTGIRHKSSMSGPQQHSQTAHTNEILEVNVESRRGDIFKCSVEKARGHKHRAYFESHLDSTSQTANHDNKWAPDKYHTSEILVLRDIKQLQARSSPLPQRQDVSQPYANQTNLNTEASTPASELLRDALNAVTRPPQSFSPSPCRYIPGTRAAPVLYAWPEATDSRHRIDPAQYVDEYDRPLAAEPPHVPVPRRGFSRSGHNNMRESRQPLRTVSATAPNSVGVSVPTSFAQFPKRYEQCVGVNAVLLDSTFDMTWAETQGRLFNTSSRQAKELVQRLADDVIPGTHGHGALVQDLEVDQGCQIQSQGELENSMPWSERYEMQVQDELGSHRGEFHVEPFVESEPVCETMAGFWKPNILY